MEQLLTAALACICTNILKMEILVETNRIKINTKDKNVTSLFQV